jgi:hypothetical protein
LPSNASNPGTDDFGPFAWRQEVSHPLSYGRGRRRRALISDAVFTYLRADGNGVAIEQRFLELDRATLSVDRLAAELVRYAELYRLAGEDEGPFAPIFRDFRNPEQPIDWLGG